MFSPSKITAIPAKASRTMAADLVRNFFIEAIVYEASKVDLLEEKSNVEWCAKRERGPVYRRPVPVPVFINFGDGWKGGMVVSDFAGGAGHPPRL